MDSVDRETRWLERVCLGFVALGVSLPFAWMTPAFAIYRSAVADVVGHPALLDSDLAHLVAGITGGSIAGKWTLHWAIARHALRERRRWAWQVTLAGLASWFVVDSLSSLLGGAWANVVMINGLPPMLVLPLLYRLRARCDRDPAAARAEEGTVARLAAASALVVVLAGLAIAFGTESALFAPWWSALSADQLGGAAPTAADHALLRFFAGPIGGSTVGHAVMLFAVARHGIASGEAWAARWSAISVLAWLVTDSTYSFAAHGAFNVWLVNLPCAVLLLTPLAWAAARRAPRID